MAICERSRLAFERGWIAGFPEVMSSNVVVR